MYDYEHRINFLESKYKMTIYMHMIMNKFQGKKSKLFIDRGKVKKYIS